MSNKLIGVPGRNLLIINFSMISYTKVWDLNMMLVAQMCEKLFSLFHYLISAEGRPLLDMALASP